MKPTVIIHSCPRYDVEAIRRIVRSGLDTLGLRPSGKTLVKPNLVSAGPFFENAFTRPEFAEGVLRALKDRDGGITELAVGERSGITVPTRYTFRHAGYYGVAKRVGGVRLHHFDEVQQVEIPLAHPDRLRDRIYTPAPVAEADFFVNCPKFKAHPWTTVTFGMKNYIGIQDDRHRLIDHDHLLNEKVRDLQYVLQPQFVAVDAITAGEGRMLTPLPFDLGLIIMSNNQLALDAVCCRIIGVEPLEVEHIRFAHEAGFGAVDLDSIRIEGDISLEKAQQKAEGFRVGLIRVEDYFEGTKIRAYGGRPPGADKAYCWGGCPGAMEEAIEILRIFDRKTDEKLPPLHVVFGHYEGPINANPGEKVVFMGDCTQYEGTVGDALVKIDSIYRDRSTREPLDARYEDIFQKMLKVGSNLFFNRKEDILRIPGCPVSVSEQVLTLVSLGGLKNPYLDPKIAFSFTSCYLSQKTRSVIRRLSGTPYNQVGPAERGAARTQIPLPAQ
ncbi:MAG: DUF362 domain-containing protein [Myxococcota bacterium]